MESQDSGMQAAAPSQERKASWSLYAFICLLLVVLLVLSWRVLQSCVKSKSSLWELINRAKIQWRGRSSSSRSRLALQSAPLKKVNVCHVWLLPLFVIVGFAKQSRLRNNTTTKPMAYREQWRSAHLLPCGIAAIQLLVDQDTTCNAIRKVLCRRWKGKKCWSMVSLRMKMYWRQQQRTKQGSCFSALNINLCLTPYPGGPPLLHNLED